MPTPKKPRRRRSLSPRNIMAIPRWLTENAELHVWGLMAETDYDITGFKSFEIPLYERAMESHMGRKVKKAGLTLLMVLDQISRPFEWSGCIYYQNEWVGLSSATVARLVKKKRIIPCDWVKLYPTSPIKRTIKVKDLPEYIKSTLHAK
jgi:hypothetical protein